MFSQKADDADVITKLYDSHLVMSLKPTVFPASSACLYVRISGRPLPKLISSMTFTCSGLFGSKACRANKCHQRDMLGSSITLMTPRNRPTADVDLQKYVWAAEFLYMLKVHVKSQLS